MTFWNFNWGNFGGHHGHSNHYNSGCSWQTKSWGWNKYSWANKCKPAEPKVEICKPKLEIVKPEIKICAPVVEPIEPADNALEFSAFSAAALGASLKCGSSFDMPVAADVTITVDDNDKKLSGDGRGCWGDDKARDKSGQTAEIKGCDGEAGNGGQIYAETIHTLRGSDGKKYRLVEIEQEGSDASYFTFKGAVPAAGVTLEVCYSRNTSGVKYEDLGAGEVAETLTFAETLPVGEFEYCVADDFLYGNDVDAYTLMIADSGDARFDGVSFTSAYCVGAYDALETGADLASAPKITGTMMEATAANAVDLLDGVGVNGETGAENLDLITWILNQDFTSMDNGDGTGEAYTDAEIQGAIWGLVDDETTTLGGGTTANAEEIIDLALENGEGFEAGNGDIHTVLIVPAADEAPANVQPFIIGIEHTDAIC